MRNFIARMGYIATWAFGIPKYSIEEAFEQYYMCGFIITIMGILGMLLLILLLILEFIRNRGKRK